MSFARLRPRSASCRLLVLAASVGGCVAVTINVTFPQEQIESAASSIEELVRTPPSPPKTPASPGNPDGARPGAPGARAPDTPWAWLSPAGAEAQVPELKIRTPEIMAVIESRRARYPQVEAALAAGCLGENNQGLLEPRPGPNCPPAAAALATQENRDRTVLYRTLLEQNKMPPGDLSRVQAAFALANRERAPAGGWVQDEAGRWRRK